VKLEHIKNWCQYFFIIFLEVYFNGDFNNRPEFNTTFIEENAIAASAMTGWRSPKTANGMATIL
jgi:hypothetical protein